MLMKDLRAIRKFEVDWKASQQEIQKHKSNMPGSGGSMPSFDIGALVDQLAEEM